VEEPEISIVVELRLGRAGVLAAEDPKLTAALTRDDSLKKKMIFVRNLINCFNARYITIAIYFLK
jgi:hypothetical protein